MHTCVILSTIHSAAGVQFVAPSPFFNAQWKQHRNGSECVQLFAALAPKHATVHALISRADYSAEATKLQLQYGSDLEQMLAQVKFVMLVHVVQYPIFTLQLLFAC